MNRRTIALIAAVTILGVCAWYALGLPGYSDKEQIQRPSGFQVNGVRGLIVEPDDGRTPLVNEIDAARENIDLMIYILSDHEIVDALIRAEARGVDVRVIMEEHPYGGFGNPEEVVAELRTAGAEVRWSSSDFTFTHAKTILFDRSVVAILNLNLTRSAFEDNREFGVVSTWPDDVQLAQVVFDADWSEKGIATSDTLVISPINSREEIVGLIDGARESILMYAEVIRDAMVVSELIEAESRGVEVQILLSPDADPRWTTIEDDLLDSGVEIRISNDLYIHAKAIVADSETAYVGSQNFTMTSLDENREIGILVTEPDLIDRIETTFRTDFAAATRQS